MHENVELMHEYFPKHSRTGTARMKQNKEEDKKRGVSVDRNKAGTKNELPHRKYCLGLPSPRSRYV